MTKGDARGAGELSAPAEPIVYILDDDDTVRESLLWLVESAGRRARAFSNPVEFLRALDCSAPGCVILDMRMPIMSGFDVQEELNIRHAALPIIFITGHGGVPMSVRAMKSGAFDFIEKPYSYRQVLDSVEDALRKGVQKFNQIRARREAEARIANLSPRERDVLEKIFDGKPVKVIAHELGISIKTVDVHRTNIREKLEVDSIAHIVRLFVSATDTSR